LSRVDDAVRLFGEGYACSQAVLVAFAPSLGLDGGKALRIAAGFAAGMRLGETCGAVTGAIMVLGLALCDEGCASRDGRGAIASAVDTFAGRFEERVGAIDCPDIIGCDTRSPEGRASAQQQGLFAQHCAPAVRAAAEILEEMLATG
jgi:C_GCAxxG_C_C family probable redox protein